MLRSSDYLANLTAQYTMKQRTNVQMPPTKQRRWSINEPLWPEDTEKNTSPEKGKGKKRRKKPKRSD